MRTFVYLICCCCLSFSLWAQEQHPAFYSLESPEKAFERAKALNKPLFLEAMMPSCGHCQAFDETFKKPSIIQYLKKEFAAHQLDVSKKENLLFLRKKNIFIPSTPTFLVFGPDGELWHIMAANDAYNTEDGIKFILNRALDPKTRFSEVVKNIQGSNLGPAELAYVAAHTKMSLDTVGNRKALERFMALVPAEKYLSETVFYLIQKGMLEENNPIFYAFLDNYDYFSKEFNAQSVKIAAENQLMFALYDPAAIDFSDERLRKIKEGLAKIGIEPSSIQQRTLILEVKRNLKLERFEQVKQILLDYYKGKSPAENEKKYWCKLWEKYPKAGACPLP